MTIENYKVELTELFTFRNLILKSEPFDKVISSTLEIVLKRIRSQTVSVFLCSKEGLIQRKSIIGFDKNGNKIESNWFPKEIYELGESFTGKVIMPTIYSTYGEPQWSDNLSLQELDIKGKEEYIEKLGGLYCAISVPLNGRHCTYGALEAINKIDRNRRSKDHGKFSKEDVFWMSTIAMNLATAISSLRRKDELDLLSEIGKLLVKPLHDEIDEKNFYFRIVKKLTGSLMPYKACILRIANDNLDLEIVARSGETVTWSHRNDESVANSKRIVGKVYSTGQHVRYNDLEKKIDEFENKTWIKINKFKSFICIPLSMKESIVGTLSLFTGYRHSFYENDVAFLNNIGFLIASFTERLRLTQQLDNAQRESHKAKEKRLSDARGVIYDSTTENLFHTTKNEYNDILYALKEMMRSPNKERLRIIKENIPWIQNRIKQLTDELRDRSQSFSQVDLNYLINNVIKHFTVELKGEDFRFLQNYDREIPDIEANEQDIKEIFINLIDNAVKAIKRVRRGEGIISIETEIVKSGGIEYIQISVKDNGIGIKNEDSENIYKRGYSTYEGGTGMGLVIVMKILSNYGGKIDFKSIVGKETLFFVRLPLKRLKW